MLMDLEGKTVKQIDSSNVSDKTAALSTAAAQTGLGGDGGDKMTETVVAQACLVIRRQKQQDKLIIIWP